ncbi:Nn.00g037200.m01.CDS01 [Neocucurbitaria sp. VM-36]
MTTRARAIELTKLNLTDIFGERSVPNRLRNISHLWVPSSEVFFLDASGTFKSHAAISEMVDRILGLGGSEDEFVTLGDVETLKHDEEDDVWVTKVKWGVRQPGGELALSGLDVLTITGGKIKACYTFLDSK